jgi:hypothetical protein
LFVGQLQRGFEALVLQFVPVLLQDLNRLAADLFGDPQVDLGDGQVAEGGGEEVGGEEVFGLRIGVGIGFGAGGPGAGGEVLGELARLLFVGELGERVPPPGGFFLGDFLWVKYPDRVNFRADAAGAVDDVALV